MHRRPTPKSQFLSVLQLTRGRYIYVPDKVVANPPLVVVIHSCQSSAQAYFQNSLIPWHRGSDNKGYVTVWPSVSTTLVFTLIPVFLSCSQMLQNATLWAP